jgi:endonuclease/exonuclease/phosphatase family metal-dependent hydrolase
MDFLAGWAEMQAVPGPTMFREEGPYGNALLSRFEVINKRTWDISVPGREPRGIIDVVVRTKQGPIRVLVTHFGLTLGERRTQAEKLVSLVFEKKEMTTILLGDINGWHPFGGALGILRKGFGRTPAPPTFPSRFPLLPLDRIWLHQGARQVHIRIRRHRTPLSRIASDHLPVTADIKLKNGKEKREKRKERSKQ